MPAEKIAIEEEKLEDILSVDEMLAAEDVEFATIQTWNGKYTRIGSLTAEDLIEWSEANDTPAKKNAGLRLFVKSLVDKDGKRIGTPAHILAFAKKNNAQIEKVIEAILKLNHMKVKGQQAVKND